MNRLDKIIVDAVFEGINDFNKFNFIKDIMTLNERSKQVDIDFGCNLCNLSDTEKKVWYFIHGYMYKLNSKVNIEEIIGIGYVYIMTL